MRPITGLVQRAKDTKFYHRSLLGSTNQQFKTANAIKFTTLVKLPPTA